MEKGKTFGPHPNKRREHEKPSQNCPGRKENARRNQQNENDLEVSPTVVGVAGKEGRNLSQLQSGQRRLEGKPKVNSKHQTRNPGTQEPVEPKQRRTQKTIRARRKWKASKETTNTHCRRVKDRRQYSKGQGRYQRLEKPNQRKEGAIQIGKHRVRKTTVRVDED